MNWASLTYSWNQRVLAATFADASTAIAVGDSGLIIRSTDGGAQWFPQSVLWDTEFGVGPVTLLRLSAVSFVDANRGVVVGDSGVVLRTTDGGTKWNVHHSGMTRRLNAVWLFDADTGIAVGDSGTMARTTDGGATWIPQPSGTTNNLYGIFFSNANEGTIVGEGGTILRTTAGGPPVSVHENNEVSMPYRFALEQNYPNPFNATTAISFHLPAGQAGLSASSFVRLGVFDVLGREVAVLVDERKSAGVYRVPWEASGLPSGVYFYRLQARHVSGGQAGGYAETKTMVLVK